MKEIELIEKRKANEKHFLQEDGTITAKVYSSNIHYLKNGKYEDIDNTLIKKDDCYVNKNNDYKVFFKEQGKDSLMRMERENNYLDIKLKQGNATKLKKHQKTSQYVEEVSYHNALNGIDIKYQTLPTKVKETIILNNNQTKTIKFIVDTNLSLELKDNTIIAKDQDENVFTIEKPYMEDSNGVINENISYQITNSDNLYEIELTLDSEWLDSEERLYPVYVDPTISDDKTASGIMDTYIYPNDTNTVRYNQPILKAGVERVNRENVINRTLIKFNLPTIGTGSEVINATLTLCGYLMDNITGTQQFGKTIAIHRVTAPWTEETANWENMNNNYDTRIDAVQFVNRSWLENGQIIPQYSSTLYGDVTDLVKHWYKDTPNYGILIKSAKEEYIDDAYPAFYSKNHTIQNANPEPVLSISYRNQSGLESYYDYQSQQLTDGTISVNTYNGNLVGVFNLGKTIGSQLPAILNLIYNTNDVILKNNGFRFSLSQTLKEITIDNTQIYEYIDGDGTVHCFKDQTFRVLKPGVTPPTVEEILDENYNEDDYYETREYCADEDGLLLKLEQVDNKFIIKDKYDNKMTFSKNNTTDELYYLQELEDISNNKIQINYNQSNQLVKVIDSSNHEINIDYNTANVIKVSSTSSETTIGFSNNKINVITTNNGTTSLNYNEKDIISSIIDVNGTKIAYEYYDEIPYRIKKVIQYGLNDTLGQSLIFKYGFNETSITDNKNRTNTILFNSSGNKISSNTMDTEEDINNAYSTYDSIGENNSDRYYEKNKTLYSNSIVKYVKNYLKNTSFEADTNDYNISNIGGVETSYSTDCANSGTRSLKVATTNNYSAVTLVSNMNILTGKYYTFSGYFKNEQKGKIIVSYTDKQDGKEYEFVEEFNESSKFERHDITFCINADEPEDVVLYVQLLGPGTCYIDDIQLEDGQVANNYNMVENSDFSEGLSDWSFTPIDSSKTDTYQLFAFNNNKSTALKIDLSNSTKVSKKIPINGIAGDCYDISFWIKNEGIVANNGIIVNCVNISYEPVDENMEQYWVVSNPFVPNKRWQFINYKSIAPYNYKSITISFEHNNEFNQMSITNIYFYKDLDTTYYEYDTYGNLVRTTNIADYNNTFSYDKNNQLISATTPRGKHFKFEYDNTATDRVLNAISSMGISNQVKYDSFGNPILTRISKKANSSPTNLYPMVDSNSTTSSSLTEGTYRIRSKGTEKYFKAEYSSVFLESDSCSNTLWDLEKVGDKFKFIYSVIPTYSLEYLDDILFLSTSNSNNLFILEENKNGSYHIKLATEDKYIKADTSSLAAVSLIDDDPTFEFYFEVIGEQFIENSATYSEDGRFVTSVTDSLLNTTSYTTNSTTGLVTSMTNANNQATNYTYNSKNQITSITQGNKTINYTYNTQNLLSKISQGTKEYNFTYDDFLNAKKVMIGDNITLITNEYEENNGNLLKSIYGNNHEISFDYDQFDRVQTIHKMDKDYQYLYDSNGNLAEILTNNIISAFDAPSTELEKWYDSIIKYNYDTIKRIKEYVNDNFKIHYTYDKNDNVTSKQYKLDTTTHNLVNTYDKDDNLTKTVVDNQEVNYQYDELGRLISKNINDNYTTNYDYISLGKRTSTLVNSIQNGNNRYSYQYDKLNNITHLYYNGELQKQYYYDNYNELIKEEDYNTNQKIEYNYDNFGNLLTKTTTDMTTNVIIKTDTYQYSNSNWEDQLTNFNGSSITYDAIGNPLTIGNSIEMTWINGRSLSTYEDTTKNLNISYEYNVDGIRTAKIVNQVETKYYLENSNIIYEQRGNNLIYYLYDLTGLIGLKYNDNTYYYIKNLQGDIIGILDSSYNQVVSYEYDSWGKVLSIKDNQGNEITDTTNIGIINPFRYREYYYDTETSLYYLNSRYYNPTWGRFLNADSIIGANQDILGYNLYAYVSNNPINNSDTSGRFFKKAWNWVKKTAKKVYNEVAKVVKTLNNSQKVQRANPISNSQNIKKSNSGHNNLPTIGTPNTTVQKPNGDFRIYGPDGKAVKDIDYSHPQNHPDLPNPHAHDWTWDGDNKSRGKAYDPNATEIVINTAVTAGVSYAIYRIIRMLPSLSPGMWWSIPINVATP